MKYIALSLLLLNVLYLGYNLLQEDPPETRARGAAEQSEVPTISLLSEVSGNDLRKSEVEEILNNPVTDFPNATTARCVAMGAFDDVTSAQQIAERLGAIDFGVELRAIDSPTGEYDYRVVLPPASSLPDAFRRLRELKSRDIDSYVITQGEDSLGISLGVFSSQKAAISHQADLAAEGYQAAIKEIPRLSRGYWIYASEEGREFPMGTLANAQVEYPDVEFAELSCISG